MTISFRLHVSEWDPLGKPLTREVLASAHSVPSVGDNLHLDLSTYEVTKVSYFGSRASEEFVTFIEAPIVCVRKTSLY
jgi:hypothetical protein